MGICHQVNLEYLSRVVFATPDGRAFCDTLVGTDSHTTMVNGLGVLGWGVGGIEAEAAMLGQPLSMLLPPVVGLRISGELREGTTATDVVLTVTELLRQHGVVGAFVECYGPGRGGAAPRDPGHHRQHEPRVRRHLHHVPHRPGHHRLPAVHGPRRGAPGPGGGLRQGAGPLAQRRAGTSRCTPRTLRWTWPMSSPRWPGPPVPRTGSPWPRRATPSRSPWTVHLAFQPRHPRRHRSTTWPMATWSWPPSPAAPIPRIPRSWSVPGFWPSERWPGACASKPWVKTSLAPGSRVVMDYLRTGRFDRAARAARLLPRRLRLHHLHRQFRPPAVRRERGGARRRPLRGLGALGEPQLRGSHPSRRADELPRLAAPGGGLCPGGNDGHRPHHRTPRPRPRRHPGLPGRPVAERRTT